MLPRWSAEGATQCVESITGSLLECYGSSELRSHSTAYSDTQLCTTQRHVPSSYFSWFTKIYNSNCLSVYCSLGSPSLGVQHAFLWLTVKNITHTHTHTVVHGIVTAGAHSFCIHNFFGYITGQCPGRWVFWNRCLFVCIYSFSWEKERTEKEKPAGTRDQVPLFTQRVGAWVSRNT